MATNKQKNYSIWGSPYNTTGKPKQQVKKKVPKGGVMPSGYKTLRPKGAPASSLRPKARPKKRVKK